MHLSLRDQELNHTYIETAVYKPHGNHKPQIYIRHTHTHTHTHTQNQKQKGRNLNTILKLVIKSQGKTEKEKEMNKKRATKTKQKHIKNSKSMYLSIISLNFNRLDVLIKRHIMDEQIQRQDTHICMLPKRDLLQI